MTQRGRGAPGREWRALALIVALGSAGRPFAARAAFERLPLDAWSAALGGVAAASEDPVFGNPAAFGRDAWHAAFLAARPFGLPELSEAQAGIAASGPRGTRWAIGARRFGTHAYSETEARGVLSAGLAPAAFGLAVRGLAVGGTGFAPRRTAAVDVGLAWEPEAGLRVTAALEALLGEVPGEPATGGRRTAFGVTRALGPFLVVAEAQRREGTPLSAVLGLAWEPRKGLRLGAGAREEPPSISAGLVLPVPGASVALAATHVSPLGTTLRVEIRLGPRADPSPRPTARGVNDLSSGWGESRFRGDGTSGAGRGSANPTSARRPSLHRDASREESPMNPHPPRPTTS